MAHLRADSLAMLLAAANVGAHARVLVVDSCSGLVTGAVAERLGGFGLVSLSAASSPFCLLLAPLFCLPPQPNCIFWGATLSPLPCCLPAPHRMPHQSHGTHAWRLECMCCSIGWFHTNTLPWSRGVVLRKTAA